MTCLDLHDFSPVNNRLDLLLKLKEHFPGFKVSLFTVPFDHKADWGAYLIREQLLKEVKKHLDWIQLIPHGLIHESSREFKNCTYDDMKNILKQITQAFDKDGLPYVKGFCAPHWRWNSEVIRALDDEGWWGAALREDKETTKTFYRYNYLLNEPFWEADGDLKLHGHIYGTKNDLGLCFDNLMKLPLTTKWVYATDLLETK